MSKTNDIGTDFVDKNGVQTINSINQIGFTGVYMSNAVPPTVRTNQTLPVSAVRICCTSLATGAVSHDPAQVAYVYAYLRAVYVSDRLRRSDALVSAN
jgi:hypothetical protein